MRTSSDLLSSLYELRRFFRKALLGLAFASVVCVVMPNVTEAFFPKPPPPVVGSTPQYDAGLRSGWQQVFIADWWKRKRGVREPSPTGYPKSW